MIYWGLVFIVFAVIAGALGFGGIVGSSAGIAQILLTILICFLIISVVGGLVRRT